MPAYTATTPRRVIVAEKRKTFIEVGMGAERRRGYGEKFPFVPGDIYMIADLQQATGMQARDADMQPRIRPIILSMKAIDEQAKSDPFVERVVRPNAQDLEWYAAWRGLRLALLYASGCKLPLRDESVDGVLLSNIISDPLLGDDHKTALLNEALRVLKPGRLAITREVSSPLVAVDYFAAQEFPVTMIDEAAEAWPQMKGMYDLPGRGLIFEVGPA